jgi:trans-aconitate 2-methyltransferase
VTSPWNPEQYEKFRNERSQPFFDLLALVQPIPGGRAIDLGCGTGELTRIMHDTVGANATIGLDNSETMLEKSAAVAGGGLTFKLGTIFRFGPRKPYDLLFSNAALQWVTDHEGLFPRLAAGVAPGGQIAVQMPTNADHQSHLTAFELAREEPWRTALDGYFRPWPVMPPEWYAEQLDALGFVEQSVRLQVYAHHLDSREDVVEWVKGSLLTDYQRRMDPAIWPDFLEAYRARLMPRLADTHPYFYAFKRVLIWAKR